MIGGVPKYHGTVIENVRNTIDVAYYSAAADSLVVSTF